MNDLTIGGNLNFIRKDRGRRGGGVAICYNPTKIKLATFSTGREPAGGETVCAVGNSTLTKRKIAIISVYLPPSLNQREVVTVLEGVVATAHKIKCKFDDPIIFVGGDFNRKKMDTLTDAFPELNPIEAGATRNGAALDEIYCNVDRNIVHQRNIATSVQRKWCS